MSARFDVLSEKRRSALRRSFLFCALLLPALVLSSCASPPYLQPEINSLLVANRWAMALSKIEDEKSDYGQGNYLLYYLDRGLLEQLTGHNPESIQSFEKAKRRFERLYTQSLSAEAASWVVNDYELPYRGSDYEYVLVNVFQALNYIQLGRLDEALVEARDLDSKFQVIEEVARNSKRKHFDDNGFARMFMGLLYEAAGSTESFNDAWIAYRQALALYDGYYGGGYVPRTLQERLIALAERFGDEDVPSFRQRFPDAARAVHAEGAADDGQAVLCVVHSVGFSPLKVPQIIPVPLDREFIAKVTFPKFAKRYYEVKNSRLIVEGPAGTVKADLELGANIENIAIRDLESQKGLILSKAVLRPALKYMIERKQKEDIEKRHGRGAAEVFGLIGNLYNLYSEQADLRSWQALPAQVHLGRLALTPGHYHVWLEILDENRSSLGLEDLGEASLAAGETKFMVRRAAR